MAQRIDRQQNGGKIELAMVAFGRVSRTAVAMSGRSFLVNKSVPRCILEARLEDSDAVKGVFLFPFHLEDMDVDVTAGGRLARVDCLRSIEALIICFLPTSCCNFTQPVVLRMCSCSY